MAARPLKIWVVSASDGGSNKGAPGTLHKDKRKSYRIMAVSFFGIQQGLFQRLLREKKWNSQLNLKQGYKAA